MAAQLLLQKEFNFYLLHQDELVQRYYGKVIAIKGHEVLGEYDSYLDAYVETSKDHPEGTFMLQMVSEGAEDYSATFHSRVISP